MPADTAQRMLFAGSVVAIGEFRCRADNWRWTGENLSDAYLVAFPRVPVLITQAGREPVVADANQVMYYNRGQSFRRARISAAGDECEVFVIDPALAAEAVGDHDPRAADGPDVFAFTSGPGDRRAYLGQRLLYEHVRHGGPADTLRIEEAFVAILRRVVADAYRARAERARAQPARARTVRAECAESAKSLIARNPARATTLSVMADALGVSPYHLCRIFRAHTGLTLSRYRDRLRVRGTLAMLSDTDQDVGSIGLGAGYSSHSHYTDAFRREFGTPPSGYRARARGIRGRPGNPAEGDTTARA